MIQRFNIPLLVRERAAHSSFHVASEQHLRIEYRNLLVGQAIGPFTYDGDLVVTCYRGAFRVEVGDEAADVGELDQVVVPAGKRIKIECSSAGTAQIIWTPAQAKTTPG